jgi:hypothetical protein
MRLSAYVPYLNNPQHCLQNQSPPEAFHYDNPQPRVQPLLLPPQLLQPVPGSEQYVRAKTPQVGIDQSAF